MHTHVNVNIAITIHMRVQIAITIHTNIIKQTTKQKHGQKTTRAGLHINIIVVIIKRQTGKGDSDRCTDRDDLAG